MSWLQHRPRVATALGAAALTVAAAVGPTAVATPSDPLIHDFAELAGRLDAAIGVALLPAGAGGQPLALGAWRSGPAWSTMKVPLVLAALRAQPVGVVTADMVSAITRSDNVAAEALWNSLGPPETAGAAVEAVLRDHGDPTPVQSQRIRPEFSAFGQSDWPLVDQARFLAAAACEPRDVPVLDLMAQIAPDQRWGIGEFPNIGFKGGWGPSPADAYLVRQMALIPTPGGITAVAVAAVPASGRFDDGKAAVGQIADWLTRHAGALPARHCGSQ